MGKTDEEKLVYMPRPLFERLTALAEQTDESANEHVRQALWDYDPIKNVDPTPEARLASIEDEQDEIDEQMRALEAQMNELRERHAELEEERQTVVEELEQEQAIVAPNTYSEGLDDLVEEALPPNSMVISRHHSAVKQLAESFGRTPGQVVRDLYETRPILTDDEFTPRDVEASWTRDYGSYEEALALLERRAEYSDLDTKAMGIAEQFDIEKEHVGDGRVNKHHVVYADAVEQGVDVLDMLDDNTREFVEPVLEKRNEQQNSI